MTQTPDPKTPTRAEALEQAKHAVSYAAVMSLEDEDYVEICPSKLKIWKEFLSALSAQDAPIVEGLDEALDWYEKQTNSALYSKGLDAVLKAARLYAQGRTQSAVPDDAKIIEKAEYDLLRRLFTKEQRWHIANMMAHNWSLIGVTEFVLGTKYPEHLKGITPDGWSKDQVVFYAGNDRYGYSLVKERVVDPITHEVLVPDRDALLSAAPPVTGGAWLPIETAPKDGDIVLVSWPTGEFQRAKYLVNEQGRGDFWFESSRGRHLVNKIGFTHWMIPTPPSSAEKEGV